MFVPLSALTAATKDDKPKQRERGARDPCERLLEVRGNAKGLHKRCGSLGGGSGVARGDFNGDGVGDLAVGIPDENVGSVVDAGAVQIIYGSAANGLTAAGNQVITQDSPGVAGIPEANDHFGLTLAAVEINGDSFSDLAIGAPDEDITVPDAGLVQILIGTSTGLVPTQSYDLYAMRGERCACNFGAALAWGDFDQDGLGDLAIGVPMYEVEGEFGAGAVIVLYADADPGVHQIILNPSPVNPGFSRFGMSLAAGDRNGDGFDDLAVGAPTADVRTGSAYTLNLAIRDEAGIVFLYDGNAIGLAGGSARFQSDAGGTVESGDQFGRSLAFGDLDGDGRDDLIVGAPYENLGSHNDAGAVSIFYGLQIFPIRINRTITQDNLSGVEAEAGDLLGHALAAGDFDGDGIDDLAIGAPGEDIGNPFVLPTYFQNTGLVHVLYGDSTVGAGGGGGEIWHQDTSGVPGANETGDMFGYSLSAWNFGRSSHRDLAIGVPYDDINGFTDAGQVTVLYGSSAGLGTSGAQSWHQGQLGGLESNDRFGKSMY
jgi:hypothetical protein